MKPLRIAVVGSGYMGRLHLRKVTELAECEPSVALACLVEPDPERRKQAAEAHGVPAFEDHRELAAFADAAIVAAPTVAHRTVAEDLLRAGLDVLVEKPLAADLEEAEALLDLAHRSGCCR